MSIIFIKIHMFQYIRIIMLIDVQKWPDEQNNHVDLTIRSFRIPTWYVLVRLGTLSLADGLELVGKKKCSSCLANGLESVGNNKCSFSLANS